MIYFAVVSVYCTYGPCYIIEIDMIVVFLNVIHTCVMIIGVFKKL